MIKIQHKHMSDAERKPGRIQIKGHQNRTAPKSEGAKCLFKLSGPSAAAKAVDSLGSAPQLLRPGPHPTLHPPPSSHRLLTFTVARCHAVMGSQDVAAI